MGAIKDPSHLLDVERDSVSRLASWVSDRRVHDQPHAEGALALSLEHPRHLLRARGRPPDLPARTQGVGAPHAGRNLFGSAAAPAS